MKLTTTKQKTNFVKCLVHGDSGIGKTWLCQTAEKPIIICAERGLLTLKDVDIPVIEISSFEDLEEALEFIKSEEGDEFKTVCLDSITDIFGTILSEEAKTTNNNMTAYGNYNSKATDIIHDFINLEGKHVYITAQTKVVENEDTGVSLSIPTVPGSRMLNDLPYLFDFVLFLKMIDDGDGGSYRCLQTEKDYQYFAKSRSNVLDPIEEPHLAKLFAKALEQPYEAKVPYDLVDHPDEDEGDEHEDEVEESEESETEEVEETEGTEEE